MISHFPTDRGLSRRSLLRAATVAGIAVATGIGPSSATTTRAAQGANAMPTLADGLASTPLGDQVDRVARRYTVRGTQVGPLYGHLPSGRSAILHGLAIDRLAAGRIVESWIGVDVPRP